MNHFSDLTDDLSATAPARPATPEERHTCYSCGGTGRWRGRGECYGCGGRGWHRQPAAVRRAAKAKRDATIVRNRADRVATFREAHPDLYATMVANAEWCEFFRDILERLPARGITEAQIAACQRTAVRIAERRAERAAAREAAVVNVGVSAIEALFAAATANGLRKPIFRTGRLAISPAPAHGRNAGAIYVKDRGEYAGKIVAGRFLPAREAADDVGGLLTEIAADPAGFARANGRATGTCCCCGRELTDPASVEAGIGPICAGKWGL